MVVTYTAGNTPRFFTAACVYFVGDTGGDFVMDCPRTSISWNAMAAMAAAALDIGAAVAVDTEGTFELSSDSIRRPPHLVVAPPPRPRHCDETCPGACAGRGRVMR